MSAPLALLLLTMGGPRTLPTGSGPARAGAFPDNARLLVAWSPENLPFKTERRLQKIQGVRATTVTLGLDWMTSARRPGGSVERAPSGYRIPIEFAYVDAREYRNYIPDAAGAKVEELDRGEAILARGEAKLRRAGAGLRMRFGDRTVRAVSVLSNAATHGYEAVAPRPAPKALSRTLRSVLIAKPAGVSRARIRKAIMDVLPAGRNLRIASQEQTEFLRYAEVVQPPLVFKRVFGEFAARAGSGVGLTLAPPWVGEHIRSDSVPILGRVTCHKRIFRQLRGALGELRDRGLGHLVDPSQYAGCYNARYVAAAAGARISRHTWGIALDINAGDNPYGAPPNQDARLVSIMKKWGFTWGGPWPTPDSMHFEWDEWP